MILFNKIPMAFEGKEYEIRVLYDNNNTINVVTFLNNYPANGFRHQIKLPKKCNIKGVLERDATTELIEITKNDIRQKRWEKLTKVIIENIPSAQYLSPENPPMTIFIPPNPGL